MKKYLELLIKMNLSTVYFIQIPTNILYNMYIHMKIHFYLDAKKFPCQFIFFKKTFKYLQFITILELFHTNAT